MDYEEGLELDYLIDCVKNLQDFMENAMNSTTVTEEDCEIVGVVLDKLENAKMKLENKLGSIKYEEI